MKTINLSKPYSTEVQAATPERGSVASQGLRAGLRQAGAGLSALAGTGLEFVGADNAAQSMYDTSAGLRARAAAAEPLPVQSFDQVDGLDSLGKYAVGLGAQAVPMLGAGLAGAVLARRPMVGATLAATPLAAGDVAVRQQEDPAIAGLSAGRRLGSALGTGVVTSALGNAVPVAMGGKLLGRGVSQAPMSLGRNVATNLGEAVAGNAAAGAASEAITQNSLGMLNENRDTSGDMAAIKEAAAGGAVMGLPFAAAGVAGQAARGPRAAPRTDGVAVGEAPAPAKQSVVDRIKGVFTKDEATTDLETADRIARDEDIIDVEALRTATPDQQAVMLDEADASRSEKVKAWATKMFEDSSLSPEQRAVVDDFMANPADRTKQAAVAGFHKARETGKKTAAWVQEFADKMSEKFDNPVPLDTATDAASGAGAQAKAFYDKMAAKFGDAAKGKQSDAFSPKLHNAMADAIAPSLAKSFPDLLQNDKHMQVVTGALRKTMAMMQATGKLDDDTAEQLHRWFGDDTPSVMASLHSAVLDGADKAASEKYFAAINEMTDQQGHVNSVEGVIRESLPEDMQATPEMVKSIVRELRAYMDGDGANDKPKAQVEFETAQVEAGLKQHFGKNYDRVMRVMTGDAARRAKKLADEQKVLAETDPEQGVNVRDEAEIEAEAEPVQYRGAGKKKDAPELVRSPEAHRAEFDNVGQAERLIREAQHENPDRIVEFVKVKDLPDDVRAKYPDAGPDDGLVTISGTRDETRLTPDEMKSFTIDTHGKTSHNTAANASRIETGVRGAVIDARKLVKAMKRKLDYNVSDNYSSRHRSARAFMEGIAAVQDHLGATFDIPDDVVVEPGLTYGDIKGVSMRPPDAKWMNGLNDDEINAQLHREDALKEMDDRELDKATMKMQDVLARREGAFNTRVKDLRSQGVRMSKESYREMRREMGVDDARRALDLAERESGKREAKLRHARLMEEQGRHEQDPHGESSVALFKGREEGEARTVGFDDNPLRKDNFSPPKLDGSLPDHVVSAIDTKIAALENARLDNGGKNKIAWALGQKARVLFANFDKLSRMDQYAMASLPKDRNLGTIADTVNALTKKYESVMEAPKPSFGKDTRTRSAVSAIVKDLNAAGIAISSSDLMTRYERGFAQHESRGLPSDTFLRKFASQLGVPVKTLKGLDELYRVQGLEGASAKKPSAFVERVLGKGDLAPVIDAIKASDDPVAVRRAVDALAGETDARARQVLDAANEKLMSMIEADPDVAYSLQRTSQSATHSAKLLTDVEDHIAKVLGKTVDVEFTKMLHAGEFKVDSKRKLAGMSEHVIRISLYALDPMGTAYHESLHAFVKKLRDAGLMDEAHPLMKAADSAHVRTKLRELLAGDVGALRQIDQSLEERAAYMYQFWAAGKLTLPTKPTTILGHIAEMFRKVLGVWSNDQRATHIMEYFQSGEYAKQMGNRDAVARSLMMGTNERIQYVKEIAAPASKLADALFATGNGRLRDTAIPALVELADKVYAPLQGEHGDPGYVPAARIKRGEVMNRLAERLAGFEPAVVTDALTALQRGVKGGTPETRLAMREVRKVLDEMFDYMRDAGVQVNDLGYGKDYFPRVWDPAVVLSKEKEFRAMLEKYKVMGKFDGSVDQVMAAIMRADGSDLQVETVKPGMLHTRKRVLSFISALDAEPFLQKDLYHTMNSYVTQATRRAEWSRRFSDDGSKLGKMFKQAREEGATKAEIQMASDYLQGVDGTLGDKLDPKLRRAFGNMVVYQNIRLLPLAIFSSLIDPMGVMVRGGTVGDAYATMKRGFREIPKGFKKGAEHDEATKLAAHLGVIDSAVLRHALGSSYSQGMTSNLGRKINDTFFKYNLMEQFNTSMRVGATEAAVGFLGRHADGKASAHSPRWLAELGLEVGDVVVKNGRALVTYMDFKREGFSDSDAQARAAQMTLAVNRWVDGAVLRPNAAHKPVWMNDPHFAIIAHLKQFVYAFQETILKRVANEARYGNVAPAYALAAYVPFMIAADLAKGALVSGGGEPDNRENWDAADYAAHGVQRAGLFGVGQIGIDIAKDVQRGGVGIGAVAGPTIEQLGDAVSVVGGSQQFATFAMNALPANALLDAAGEISATNADVN